jgi:tRNA-(MS[2]IO[6]A)-hydroxylase (MiaE)-like
VSSRGTDRVLAGEKQRAIRSGIKRLEDRHAYALCNAVGGDHIPRVIETQCIKLTLVRPRTSVAWRAGPALIYSAVVTNADAAAGASAAAGPPPDGVLDLLGLLAYASLTAFFRLSEDAARAISLSDKTALADMAVVEFGHFQVLRRRIEDMSADPQAVMQPFVVAIDAFHARTAPADWLEGLVKAYVGDGIAADFYRAAAEVLDQATRDLVLTVLADTGHSEFVIARVREAIELDPRLPGRLALWARRLVGEALGQAQRVAAEREPLARLLVGDATSQLGDIGRMFAQLTDAHAARMAALGLDAS